MCPFKFKLTSQIGCVTLLDTIIRVPERTGTVQ